MGDFDLSLGSSAETLRRIQSIVSHRSSEHRERLYTLCKGGLIFSSLSEKKWGILTSFSDQAEKHGVSEKILLSAPRLVVLRRFGWGEKIPLSAQASTASGFTPFAKGA